ncbi:SCO4848 family membrane protein [Candidatus Frankia alpina]|uniref:SCO4848 family membrane protein n=1 Tax=Candidatus Frankia alpina TaxID=2699483 RepID=UPI003AF42FD5
MAINVAEIARPQRGHGGCGCEAGGVTLSKRASWFLIAVGVWSWAIWPNFLRNIWKDDRFWDNGPTGFFTVHLVLTVVSLVIGSVAGWLGIRAARAGRSSVAEDVAPPKQLINSDSSTT